MYMSARIAGGAWVAAVVGLLAVSGCGPTTGGEDPDAGS